MKRFFLVPLVIVMFIACNKYEEGPDFSLRSKTERISNRWVISAVLKNGTDQTLQYLGTYKNYQLNIGRDHQYSSWYKVGEFDSHSETGEWKFSDDKTQITMTNTTGKSVDYVIKRLEQKDLRLKYNDSQGSEWEMHLVPKPD